jgi:hypothetical protein
MLHHLITQISLDLSPIWISLISDEITNSHHYNMTDSSQVLYI